MKFRNLLAMLPVLAAYSCTFDEGGLPGGRRPNLRNEEADGFVNPGDEDHTKDAKNTKSRDAGLDGKIIKKDGNIDSMVFREDAGVQDAGRDLGADSFARDSGVDAPYFREDAGRDSGLSRDMGRDLVAADIYSPDMGRDGSWIFPDIVIRPFDLGSDARDAGLDLGRDGLRRDLGLDGIVADAGRDLGPDGPPLPVPYECDANTVALYHFDQPEPFSDSCRTHHLTNNGTTESVGQPGFGESRYFDNRSYLQTLDSPELNFGSVQDFTMEARFKTNIPPNLLDFMIGKLPGGSPASGYGIFYYDGGWCCAYWSAGATYLINSGRGLVDDSWHHIACTRYNSGTGISMHIDGELVSNSEIPLVNVSDIASFVIGSSEQGIIHGWGPYTGDIDEVKISNIARTFE